MVYIYKKKAGGKTYYYLRASERKDGKIVIKDIAYLGNNLESVKKALDKLPKYKKEIRKTYKTIHNFLETNHWIEKAQKLKLKKDNYLKDKLVGVEACKLHYNQVFSRQDDLTKKEILKNFVIEFAHNTTFIEGNTINLAEARNLLENNKTPKDKTLREIYDLQNTEEVFNWIFDINKKINSEFIIEVHKRLLNKIDSRTGYRTQDIRVLKANFKATPAPYVKTDMDLLLKWYDSKKDKLHPLALAIIFHHKFEKIHPFMDGNGRTGRMLMNYILLRNKYPPLILRNKNRKEYLDNLRQADKTELLKAEIKDYEGLIQFSANELTENYWNIFL